MPLKSHSSAPAPAPAVETAPVSKKEENTKAKAAVVAETDVTENMDNSIIGSKSDKIAFVCALGDPSQPDVTNYIDANTKEPKKRTDPTIVGYVFKALEDMEIPDCGTNDDFKSNRMSYANIDGKRAVKAGEEFNMTPFETGMLLSPPEFNARATGGEIPVSVAYSTLAKRNAKGQLQKVQSAEGQIPSVALRAIGKAMSIKDIKMREVLTFTVEKLPNGQIRRHRTLNPGYDNWAPLCKETPRRTSSAAGGAAAQKIQRNRGAVAFMETAKKKAMAQKAHQA